MEPLNWAPMMPRDPSLSDSCTLDRPINPRLVAHRQFCVPQAPTLEDFISPKATRLN